MRKIFCFICIGLFVPLMIAMAVQPVSAEQQGVKELIGSTMKKIGGAYMFGYPLLLIDVTEKTDLKEAGANELVHNRYFPDHTFRNVVKPNRDTLYSVAWLDLKKKPMVFSVPEVKDRYYVLPMMDAWSNVFARIGTATTGSRAGDYAVVGPDWKGRLPDGLDAAIVSPTNRVWVIGRIQADGKEDFQKVFKLQETFEITPLSRWPEGKPNPSHVQDAQDAKTSGTSCMKIVENYPYDVYFNKLSTLMGKYPPAERDKPMLKFLERFGIVPGKEFKPENLDPLKRELLAIGVEKTRRKMEALANANRANENGWQVFRKGLGRYGTQYGFRALVAKLGLGALPPEEAAYATALFESRGKPLNGENRYKIHFAKGATPPAEAFWSLTVYDKEGYMVKNPIDRYKIGGSSDLDYNEDGSLDIYLQHNKPEQGTANWLPVPEGRFRVTLRLYQPEERFLNGTWKVPPIKMTE